MSQLQCERSKKILMDAAKILTNGGDGLDSFPQLTDAGVQTESTMMVTRDVDVQTDFGPEQVGVMQALINSLMHFKYPYFPVDVTFLFNSLVFQNGNMY